jgi:hypothetical protein
LYAARVEEDTYTVDEATHKFEHPPPGWPSRRIGSLSKIAERKVRDLPLTEQYYALYTKVGYKAPAIACIKM